MVPVERRLRVPRKTIWQYCPINEEVGIWFVTTPRTIPLAGRPKYSSCVTESLPLLRFVFVFAAKIFILMKTQVRVSTQTVEPAAVPLVTRLFYAQRYIEKQYQEVKNEAHLRWWNQWIYRTLKIESLEPASEYTTWKDDSLAERNSHWLACAGLLTTEIMGAMLVPQSMSYLGYVPGNIMLFVFFGFALVAGGLVWWLFILFDSPEYPIRTFADIAELLGGRTWRHLLVFLQVVAMILTSATIIIGAAEGLEIMRDQRVCFCGLVVLLCGVQAIIGHLKQLKQLGNLCVWISVINYVCLFAQLGFFKEPNWDNAKAVLGLDRGEVHSYAVAPQDFVSRLVSVTSLSYVFAGLLVFPEILAEMRRPWDFWKSMLLAQVCILATYLLYGNFVYARQGQFSNSPAALGIANIAALRGFGFVTFVTGFVQATFYGHLSAKVVYKNYLPEIFKNLRFNSVRGTLLWSATTCLVWIVIFLISAGVPNVMAVAAFTSALTMIPLTYMFPYLFNVWALCVKTNAENIICYDAVAMKTEGYEHKPKKYIKAGIRAHKRHSGVFLSILALASVFAVMGIAGSIGYMVYVFANTSAESFSCKSPI
ncbi:hypothetical protein KL906_004198 [Ogataea polymorpha]|nr:hypothetical protein KL906_004198 [Ogataea polymorpha]KAG7914664.1 hypothetical protein KL927_004333 [Ogataea polymorpha]